MERILSDFRRHRAGMLVKCTVIAVVMSGVAWGIALIFGGWAEWFGYVCFAAAGLVSALCLVLLVKAFIEMLVTAPKKLAAQISAMPQREREQLVSAYPAAKTLGERWFLPEHILFYTNRRAVVLRYDAIKGAVCTNDGDILLMTSSGDVVMPVAPKENAGIIYAVLRSRNPEIKKGNLSEAQDKETERT